MFYTNTNETKISKTLFILVQKTEISKKPLFYLKKRSSLFLKKEISTQKCLALALKNKNISNKKFLIIPRKMY